MPNKIQQQYTKIDFIWEAKILDAPENSVIWYTVPLKYKVGMLRMLGISPN